MGTTTAGLPLRPGEHHERCPGCSTVFRTKRRTRFRCPKCHRLMHALHAPEAAGYVRRALEGDERTFRVYLRRPAEGETADPGDDTAAMFLEDADAPAPAPDAPPSPAPARRDGPPVTSPTAKRAAADREAGGSRLGKLWRGSLGDWFRG